MRTILLNICIGIAAFSAMTCQQRPKDNDAIQIDFWYGDHQIFGRNGLPQRWVNILGNVHADQGIAHVEYALNDSSFVALAVGTDLHRLAAAGDFNIELALQECREGENKLMLKVEDSTGQVQSKKMIFELSKKNRWPLPYRIHWAEVDNLQEAVQVVDGHWEVSAQGLVNKDMYYDRVVAFGDANWTDYEVHTTVTFLDFVPPKKGPPTYNVAHAAIASRWPGHDPDTLKPHRKWYPLGATAEFRLTAGLDSCRWRIFDGPNRNTENFYLEQPKEDYRHIRLSTIYRLKHRVETVGRDSTRYSAKLWPINEDEPQHWDLSGIERNENIQSGSALLIAHHTRVIFGDVYVNALNDR